MLFIFNLDIYLRAAATKKKTDEFTLEPLRIEELTENIISQARLDDITLREEILKPEVNFMNQFL